MDKCRGCGLEVSTTTNNRCCVCSKTSKKVKVIDIAHARELAQQRDQLEGIFKQIEGCHNPNTNVGETISAPPDWPPKSSSTKDIARDMCAVCLTSDRNTVFLPCKHMACCEECSKRILKIDKRCPICRGKISEYIDFIKS